MNTAAALMPARAKAPVPAFAPPVAANEIEGSHADMGGALSLSRIPLLAPAPPAPSRAAVSLAAPSVQRKCEACETEEKEEQPKVQARLEVGAADDPFEREADEIAGHVMSMPTNVVAFEPRQQRLAGPTVQRACASCTASPDDDAMARRLTDEDSNYTGIIRMSSGEQAPAQDGAADLTEQALTRGGSPLPAATRDYFESRMGRNLSAVKVHRGPASNGLNRSIGARAFTYRNHVWLGPKETDAPSFTLAHELAHVLQQTSPGEIGAQPEQPGVEPAGSSHRVTADGTDHARRFVAYWQPAGTHAASLLGTVAGATVRHGRIHGEIQEQFVTSNSGLVTEVRIPDAGTATGCGYADLYKSDNNNVPGIEPDGAGGARNLTTEPPPGQPPTACMATWAFHPMLPRVGTVPAGYHHSHRYPRINAAGTLTGCDRAPTQIWIGDVKPGHNEDARRDGQAQIAGYNSGIERTAALTPASCWRPNARVMQGNQITIPADLQANRSGGWNEIPSLELRLSSGLPGGSDIFQPQAGPRGGTHRIRGRTSAVKDRVNTNGIWVYFVEPNPQDLQTQFGRSGGSANFTASARRLQTILNCLKSHPNRRRSLCRRTDPAASPRLKRGAPGPMASKQSTPFASSAQAKVRRTVEDRSFSFANWNAMRVGSPMHPQHASNNLRSVFNRDVPESFRNRVKFQNAVVRAEDWFNANYGSQDHSTHVPPGTAVRGARGIVSQARQVERLEFWSDPSPVAPAAIFGRLRATFGNVFVRAVAAYESLKRRARAAFRSTQMRGGGGSALAAVARRVGVMVLTTLGTIMMRKIGGIIIQCLERGFTDYMTRLTEGESMEELTAKFHEAEALAVNLREDLLGNFETLAERVIGPLRGWLDEIAAAGRIIGDVVGVATLLARGMRVVTCLSGLSAAAVGAIVTCLASALDLVLSVFGVSPIDWVVGRMMQSCRSRRMLARVLMASDLVQALPQRIAREILTTLRNELPEGAREIMCDPDTLVVEPLSMTEFNCSESYSGDSEDGDGDSSSATDGSGGSASEGAPGSGESRAEGSEGAESASATGGTPPHPESAPTGSSSVSEGTASDAPEGEGSATEPLSAPRTSGTTSGEPASETEVVSAEEIPGQVTDGRLSPISCLVTGGINLRSPPTSGTLVHLSLSCRLGDNIFEMEQGAIFLAVVPATPLPKIRFYFPEFGPGETPTVVSLSSGQRIGLARGPDAIRLYPYAGSSR